MMTNNNTLSSDIDDLGAELNATLEAREDANLNFTDTGNARRLINQYTPNIRYVYAWNRWVVWNETYWEADKTGLMVQKAKEIARCIQLEAESVPDPDQQAKLAKYGRSLENRDKIAAMLYLAQSEPGVPIDVDTFDTHPWLLNVRNGILDLKTLKLHKHNKRAYLTKYCDVEYDPGTTSDTWVQFLYDITDGNVDLINYLARAAGYALTGLIQDQALFFLYGTGDNGKSTFLNALINTLGDDYAYTAPHTLLISKYSGESHPTATATLYGRRLIVTIEAEGGRGLAEALVKSLTGGDKVSTRRMREDFWQFTPTHKIFLAANYKPRVRGTDHAIWKRIKLIPFTVQIAKDKIIRNLGEILSSPENKQAILTWMVAGCKDWFESGGLNDPDIVKECTNEYRAEQNIVEQWVKENCIEDKEYHTESKELYKNYHHWCEENKIDPMKHIGFGQTLGHLGFSPVRNSRKRYWEGIGIASSFEK